jgi:hypothetical protein
VAIEELRLTAAFSAAVKLLPYPTKLFGNIFIEAQNFDQHQGYKLMLKIFLVIREAARSTFLRYVGLLLK